MNDLFNRPVRKISAGVDMNFYVNSNDNDAAVEVFWDDKFRQKNQWRYDNRNQVLSYGLKPKYKYATLDGYTKLAKDDAEAKSEAKAKTDAEAKTEAEDKTNAEDKCYVCLDSPSTVLPLCFESLSEGSAGDPQGEYKFAEGQHPTIRLDYHGLPRKVSQLMLIGDETWGQYPVSYNITLKLQAGTGEEAPDSYKTDVPDFEEYNAKKIEPQKEKDGTACYSVKGAHSVKEPQEEEDTVYYTVEGANSVKQVVRFGATYQAIAVTLEVLAWSAAHTTAKIMYFSNDFKISMQAGEVSSVSVLEEKTGSIEDLGYGITSNSCTVVVSNADKRFSRNRDLLKRNRSINPYLVATDLQTDVQSERQSLGRFFSSDWQLTSTSSFVTCKAYDVLYELQNVQLHYPMEQDENGHYVMDGTESGRNANAYLVFRKIFNLINAYKAENGIYGSEIVPRIDKRLKNISMQYVLLGSDTAWNMLQSMANFSLSNVYVDRDGRVCVVRDDLRAVEGKLPVPDSKSGSGCSSECGSGCSSECGSGCSSKSGSECGSECGSGCSSECSSKCGSECCSKCSSKCCSKCVSECFSECCTERCAVAITPSNSFSYNLPSMNKTVVNRVKIPYVALSKIEKYEVLTFQIEKTDFIINKNEKDENESITINKDENESITINKDENESITINKDENKSITINKDENKSITINKDENKSITINIDLENMYSEIQNIKCYKNQHNDDNVLTPISKNILYNACSFTFDWCNDMNNIIVDIIPIEEKSYKLKTNNYTEDNLLSQNQNGLREYELKSANLIIGDTQAKEVAKLLLQNYKDGKSYIETDWQGTPHMELGMVFESYSRQSEDRLTYECLSNEFTIDGGLRVKTKARQKQISRK